MIRPALRDLPGVADVNALGGYVRTFEIVPVNAALAARGISPRSVPATRSRRTAATTAPAASTRARRRCSCASRAAFAPLDDIRAIVVDAHDGTSDPASATSPAFASARCTRYGAVTTDGRGEAVEGLVLGLRGANAEPARARRPRASGGARAVAAGRRDHQRLL